MEAKLNGALQKVLNLKEKGNFAKALSKLDDLVAKNKNEAQLLFEALDISLEACESRRSCLYFKQAYTSFPEQRDRLWAFAKDRLKANNDQIFAKYLIEQAIKSRDLSSAAEIIRSLGKDMTEELLKRNRVKKKSIIAASHGKSGLSGDILINIYSEALLFLGMSKRKESAMAFINLAEKRPSEIDHIEPFLKKLEEPSEENTALSYSLGCCYLARQKYEKAIDFMMLGAKKEKSFLDDFVKRISAIKKEVETPPEEIDLAFAEALLIQRSIPQAAEVIQEILEAHPAQAQAVLDLLAEHDTKGDEELLLRYLFIESAITAKQNSRAIEKIKKFYRESKTRKSIMEWLDKKYSECALPQQILMCYGEIALEEGLIDRGVEILRSILSLSPSEENAIARILEKYKGKDNKIDEFYNQMTPKEEPPSPSEDLEIEIFERSGFKFSSQDGSCSQKEIIERFGESAPSGFSEISEENQPCPRSGESFFERTPDKLFSNDAQSRRKALQDTDEKAETTSGPPQEPSRITTEDLTPTKTTSESPPADSAPDSSEDHMKRAEDLKTRLKHFIQGGSEEDAELILAEFSRLDDAEKLNAILSLNSKDSAVDARRKLFLARYYLAEDSPMEALAIMKSLPRGDIPNDLKRRFVMQMANCYRKLHMFDAAQATILQASDDFLEDRELEQFSKLNYSDYLDQICRGAAILEKAGSLE